MKDFRHFISFLVVALYIDYSFAYVEALAGNYVSANGQPAQSINSASGTHFEPQVAIACSPSGKQLQSPAYNRFMDERGRWVTDVDSKPICSRDKLDILEYCRKVYPKRDITNIVESTHYFKMDDWCKQPTKKCKMSRWIKPYRCLEGTFQSDALLVPEHCLFDHVHNQSQCLAFDEWNRTAARSCLRRQMVVRSFAMLLPCGIDLFSGVEFVCCPRAVDQPNSDIRVTKVNKPVVDDNPKLKSQSKTKAEDNKAESDESDEDDVDDSIYDDDDDDDSDENTPKPTQGQSRKKQLKYPVPSTTTVQTIKTKKSEKTTNNLDSNESGSSSEEDDDDDDDDSDEVVKGTGEAEDALAKLDSSTSAPATPDPYFSHYDARMEHEEFKAAEKRQEEHHRERLSAVMKEWSELEERYQDMKANNPKGAETFKKKMTARFQKTVAALEEEGAAEKRQLTQMHQQRVLSHINERKHEAMECFTHALNSSPVKALKVQKCLEKLFRALEKDRTHTVNHYRHLLTTSYEQAVRDKQLTADHLVDLDRTVNQSLEMLDRYPEVATKIKEDMIEFLASCRTTESSSLLGMTREDELALLEKYQAEVQAKQQERIRQKKLLKLQKEEQRQRKKEYLDEKKKVVSNLKNKKLDRPFDPETMEDERLPEQIQADNSHQQQEQDSHVEAPVALPQTAAESERLIVGLDKTMPAPAIQHIIRQDVVKAHAQSNAIHHEATFTIKKEPGFEWQQRKHHHASSSFYVMLAFAGVAMLTATVVGIAFIRRPRTPHPHTQGFVQVDQAITPEERHVSNMQVNGYENPTYKYFEARE